HHTRTAKAQKLHVQRRHKNSRMQPFIPLTTRDLVTEYLEACHDPLKNIPRWMRITTKTRTGLEHEPIARAPAGSTRRGTIGGRDLGLRIDALPAVRSGMDTNDHQRAQSDLLPHRPSAGPEVDHRLLPLRTEGTLD